MCISILLFCDGIIFQHLNRKTNKQKKLVYSVFIWPLGTVERDAKRDKVITIIIIEGLYKIPNSSILLKLLHCKAVRCELHKQKVNLISTIFFSFSFIFMLHAVVCKHFHPLWWQGDELVKKKWEYKMNLVGGICQ